MGKCAWLWVVAALMVACSGEPPDPLSLPQLLVCPWVPATEPIRLEGSKLGCWQVRATRDTKVMRYPSAGACEVDETQVMAMFEDGALVQFWQRVGVGQEHLEAQEVECVREPAP